MVIFMTALVIVVAILVLIALLRFGVSVQYDADGFKVSASAGPLRLRVYPYKDKTEAEKRKKSRRARIEKKVEKKHRKKPEEKKPGRLKTYLSILSAAKKILSRLRRRLLIKKLVIHITAAGEDPSKAAMMFGAANAAFNAVMPMLEKSFRIRSRDLSADIDFDADEPLIYVNAAVSLAVWETLYIVFAMLPALITSMGGILSSGKTGTTDGKDEKENGETPDK